MTKSPGPPSIINLIFCGCTTNCGNSCGCRRHGLYCTVACKNCAGCNCSNVEKYTTSEILEAETMDFEDEQENLADL